MNSQQKQKLVFNLDKVAKEILCDINAGKDGSGIAKLRASTELDNLLSISEYKYSRVDDGRHSFAKNGWDYYKTVFQVGNKTYTGLLNIANGNNGKLLYDITNIKERPNNISVKTESVVRTSFDIVYHRKTTLSIISICKIKK